MYEIGYEEYVYGDGVSVIEWPQLIDDILPENRYDVTISKDYSRHDNYRKIEIQKTEAKNESSCNRYPRPMSLLLRLWKMSFCLVSIF